MKSEQPLAPKGGLLVPFLWLLFAIVLPAAWILLGLGEGDASTSASEAAESAGDAVPLDRAQKELATYRQTMRDRLNSYGWIDREKGIARVPIEEGMELVLQAGLPARDEK